MILPFIVIVEWSFHLSGTRMVASLGENNKLELSRAVWNFQAVRLLLLALSLGSYLILVFAVESFRDHSLILGLISIKLISQAINPSWIIQGLQRMRSLAWISICIGTIANLSLLLTIKNSGDLIWFAITVISCDLLISIISWTTLRNLIWFRFRGVKLKTSLAVLKDSLSLFLPRAFAQIYSTLPFIFAGIVLSPLTLGSLVAAERIVRSAQSTLGPLTQGFYPFLSSIRHHEKTSLLKWISMSVVSCGVAGLCISLTLAIFSKSIAIFFFGAEFADGAKFLVILSPLPFLVGLSNALGIQTLATLGHEIWLVRVTASALALQLLLFFPLYLLWGAAGLAVSLVIIELAVTISFGFVAKAVWKSLL